MKKVSVLLIAVLLTGCVNTTPITKDESYMVAEYIAHTLLKYDKKYDSKLLKMKEEETEATQEQTTEAIAQVTDHNDNTNETAQNKNSTKNVNINKILGGENLTVTCTGYSIENNYKDKDIFNLEASDGKKLLILNISIKNKSDKSQNINILNDNISFRASLNGSSYTQMLTMYTYDIATYDVSVKAGETIKGVLFFSVDEKSSNAEDLSLHAIRNSNEATITIK